MFFYTLNITVTRILLWESIFKSLYIFTSEKRQEYNIQQIKIGVIRKRYNILKCLNV